MMNYKCNECESVSNKVYRYQILSDERTKYFCGIFALILIEKKWNQFKIMMSLK